MEELQLGDERYDCQSTINEGGMKYIIQTFDELTKRSIAKAVIKNSSDPETVQNFIREARITAGLEHPNIVPVHDIGLENQNEPFFIYVPFSAPHTPFQATKQYYDKYKHVKSPEKRIYYAMIHALDDAVGTIMNKLKQLKLEENTLVFLLSDNGGATYTGAADNSPLKGGKFTNFEGGINVPFIMQWKGTIPAGMIYEKPVSALDIFKTTTTIANVQIPDDRDFDGVNLMPYLLDSNYFDKVPHETLFWRSEYHKAIRKGKWKLIRDDFANRTVLYNVKTDKYEINDLSDENPHIVEDLNKAFYNWEKKLIRSNWPRVMDYQIQDGNLVYYFPL